MAFKRYKKATPGKSAGPHPYTRKDMKHAGWCHQKNIFVLNEILMQNIFPQACNLQLNLVDQFYLVIDLKDYSLEHIKKQVLI